MEFMHRNSSKNDHLVINSKFTKHFKTFQLTLMCPDLIFSSVPISKTGVFPDSFLSCRGPRLGLVSPNCAVSPSMRRDIRSKNRSTSHIGSHLSNHIDSPKVDLPSISCGNTCTCKKSP